MRRPYLVCAVAGLAAILAIAACQGYQTDPPVRCPGGQPPASTATPPVRVSGPVCCVPSSSQGCCVVMPSAPAAKAGVADLLDKLEALKAKREAIEREERETHAVLKERLREQQDRLNKLNHGTPTPVYAPATSYGPVPPPNYGIPAPSPSTPPPATQPVPTASSY